LDLPLPAKDSSFALAFFALHLSAPQLRSNINNTPQPPILNNKK